jgi:formiminoglutamase
MADLSIYLAPVSQLDYTRQGIGSKMLVHDENGFPELRTPGIAIIYVPEYRGSHGTHFTQKNEEFRSMFSKLHDGDTWDFSIYDLGTLLPGERIEDTYFALARIIEECVKMDIVPLIIGGSQDLIMACYKGFENLEQTINICSIDSRLDVGDPNTSLSSVAYVSHLLMQRPCYLFNYAAVGIQRPLVPKSEIELFNNLYFDICRLGAFNDDFKRAEPHLRNSDLMVVDFESVKSSDTDPIVYKEANGFRSDQICKIMHYAGLSDKLSAGAILNIDPTQNTTASYLLAQMIWYFIDGYSQRVGDFPVGSKVSYTKFHVHLEDFEDDLVFYKSNKSERWWLEVKYPAGREKSYDRHHLVPCSSEDYSNALKNDIPDLWWQTLQKLTN